MAWFIKPKYNVKKNASLKLKEGLWRKCLECNSIIYNKDWEENLHVCAHCGYHDRLNAFERVQTLIDAGTFVETNIHLLTADPLGFHDGEASYADKVRKTRDKTKQKEAVITGYGQLDGTMIDLAVMDFTFLGGSMGSVVGEKITECIESGTKNKRPVVIVCASGGARMHEGILSLMQMAKTSAALKRHSQEGLLYIAVLTNPTTGGVTASFAMLGDFILAEKGALIGFAGPRVIEQNIKQKLPEGFQRSEFLLEHGFVDIIVERKELKQTIHSIIDFTN